MHNSKWKQAGTFLLILLLYILVMNLTEIGCPIRWLTGIPCPGCGMTRALYALLRLDFSGAFYCHPMIYPLLVFVPWYFFGNTDTPRGKKTRNRLLTGIIILAFFVWIYRLFDEDSLLCIDLSKSVVIKCLKRMQGFF